LNTVKSHLKCKYPEESGLIASHTNVINGIKTNEKVVLSRATVEIKMRKYPLQDY
jgi:hypothetical protein